MRSFQFKVFSNVLLLNKELHIFGTANTAPQLFPKNFEETPSFMLNLFWKNYSFLNDILSVFKYYFYISREKQALNVNILMLNQIGIKGKEKRILLVSNSKTEAYKKPGGL